MAVQVSTKYLLGEFELEPEKFLLRSQDETVHLAELPFQVLLYLIEHRERYVSRQELLDRFWTGSDGYEETLTKCVSTIRTQLNDPPTTPRFIETRKKVGYRYIGPFAEAPLRLESSIFAVERTRGVRVAVEEDEACDGALIGDKLLTNSLFTYRALLVSSSVALLVIVLISYLLASRRPTTTARAPEIKSLAVLPLENLSGDPAQDYFADGMTDALISNLTQINAFNKVISRQSIMRYKGSRKSLPEIAKELNVDAVIEGTVQRSGGRVRVAARLIPAAADSPSWSRDYERDESDVLKLESDVARAVADEIRIHVTAAERARLASARSVNPQAHEAYLLGRYHLGKVNEQDVKEAVEYFQRAIQLAPDYAAAYAGLSDAWWQQGFTEANFEEVESPAFSAALKAIELDEQLAEAHITLANIKLYYLEWAAAEQEFKRALELNPGSADAHIYYGLLLSSLARNNEAIREGQIAVQLDPLSSGASLLGRILIRARRYQEALPYLERGIELEPRSSRSYFRLGDNYVQLGRYDEAIAAYRKAGELVPKSGWFKAGIARVYALTGRQREARQIISGLKTDPLAIAGVYAALGDKNEAFTILDKAIEEHQFIVYLKEDPVFESLYSDPRWQALLRRMNYPAE